MQFDVIVLGAGPGGYVCAIRAAQLGLRTAIVERDRLGGECLNYGCIPSKSLITISKTFEKIRKGERYGIKIDTIKLDMKGLQSWKSSVVKRLMNGIDTLLSGYGVEVNYGTARILGRNKVSIDGPNGKSEIEGRNIVIATGTKASELKILPFDHDLILSSKDMLDITELPESVLIVGGGAIGMEFACMLQKLGTDITVVEIMDQLLPGLDPELVRVVQKRLEANGAKIYTRSKVIGYDRVENGARVKIETPNGQSELYAQKILVSVGKRANVDELNLESIGVKTDDRGYIITDEHMMTNVPNIYAIGDVRGPPLLAHKASKEGIVAAESIAGLKSAADWKVIPDAIFTDPEIANVGLNEYEAVKMGYKVKKAKFPFAALGRALASDESDGFVKVISDAENGLILGVQIVGPEASNLISEAALAIEMGATAEDIALTIHPHPTLPEAIMEAAEVSMDRPIHQLRL